MSHKENIQEILKDKFLDEEVGVSNTFLNGELKGYLKAVKVELEFLKVREYEVHEIWEDLGGGAISWILDKIIEQSRDCQEAIELGEKA